jgi:hypothetical protein
MIGVYGAHEKCASELWSSYGMLYLEGTPEGLQLDMDELYCDNS